MDVRIENANLIESAIKNDCISLITKEKGLSKCHYIRYPILSKNRNILLEKFLENNIEASPMYIEHGMIIDNSKYPGSNRVLNELLTIPCNPYVNKDDIKRIVKIIDMHKCI